MDSHRGGYSAGAHAQFEERIRDTEKHVESVVGYRLAWVYESRIFEQFQYSPKLPVDIRIANPVICRNLGSGPARSARTTHQPETLTSMGAFSLMIIEIMETAASHSESNFVSVVILSRKCNIYYNLIFPHPPGNTQIWHFSWLREGEPVLTVRCA